MSVMFSLLSWFLLVTAAGGGLNNNLATAEEMIASNTAVVSEYWHTMLPNTVMPLAILDLLTPPAGKMTEDKYVGESSLKARKVGLHSTKEAHTHSTKVQGPSTTNDVHKSNYRWVPSIISGIQRFWGTSTTNDAQKSNYRWGPSTTNDAQMSNYRWGPSIANDVQKSNYRWGPSATNEAKKSNYRWGPSTTNDLQRFWGQSRTTDIQKSNYRWGPSTTNNDQKSNYRWGASTNDAQKSNYRWGPSTTNDVQKSNYRWGPSTTNDVQKSNYRWGPSTTNDAQKSNYRWGPSTTDDVQKSNYRWGPSTTDVVRKSNYRWGPSTTEGIQFGWGPSTTEGINFGWGPSTTNSVQKSNYRWGPSTEDDNQKRSPSTTAEYQKGDQNGVTPLEIGEPNIDRDNNKHGTMSNMVFLEEALKPGSTISCYIQPSSTTGAPLLRRDVADSIPMSTGNFANIMTMFAPASSDMAANIWSTLELCEHPQAIKGETKACTPSVESMVEFVASVLGVSTNNLQAFSSPDVPAKGVMTGRGYKVVAATRVTEAKDTITCHGVGFPFAMFMCHAVNPTRVYSVMLEEEEEVGADGAGRRMEVLAVCHLDTSGFDPAKMPVHVKPGDAPLCHFISRDSILWAPSTPTSGHATT